MRTTRIPLFVTAAALLLTSIGVAAATSSPTSPASDARAELVAQLRAAEVRAAGNPKALAALQAAEQSLLGGATAARSGSGPQSCPSAAPNAGGQQPCGHGNGNGNGKGNGNGAGNGNGNGNNPPACPSRSPNAGGKQPCGKKPTARPTSGTSASPSLSASPSSSASPTRSASPSATASPSTTVVPSATASPSTTASPTGTASPSASASPTGTASPSATASPTGTASPTASATPSATMTPGPTSSATPTATMTSNPPAGCGPASAGGVPATGPVSGPLYDIGEEISAGGGEDLGDLIQTIACTIQEELEL